MIKKLGWFIYSAANYSGGGGVFYIIQYKLLRGVSPTTAWVYLGYTSLPALMRVGAFLFAPSKEFRSSLTRLISEQLIQSLSGETCPNIILI